MKNKLTTFYIVRHGESEANVQKIFQGQKINTPLTEKGQSQAKKLAEELENVQIDIVISSDLTRAHQTAEIIAQSKKLPVRMDVRFRERSMEKYDGMKTRDFLKLYTYDNWHHLSDEEKLNHKLDPTDENFNEIYKRFIDGLQELAYTYPNKTILIVSHGGVIRGFLIKNGYGNFEDVGGIENTGYIKIKSNGVNFDIEEVKGLKTWKEKHSNTG